MPLTAQQFDAIVAKLGMATRQTDHVHAWLEVDGRVAIRTRRSLGSGELAAADKIRQQLKVNEDQLRDLTNCPMSREDYLQLLRTKGLL